jgi:hypothetical protein
MSIKKAIFFFILFCGLTSFQVNRFDYEFTIVANQVIDKIPKSITVQIVNKEKSKIKLNNLVLKFYIDREGFWGIPDSTRFLDKDLIVSANTKFITTIGFESLNFTNFGGNKVSIEEIKDKMKNSRVLKIKASMSDMRRLENPLESSSLTDSNLIEL